MALDFEELSIVKFGEASHLCYNSVDIEASD